MTRPAGSWLDTIHADVAAANRIANAWATALGTQQPHTTEALGAPGSDGAPSRWPQSSDDTGERGDALNMAASGGRISQEAAAGMWSLSPTLKDGVSDNPSAFTGIVSESV